MCRLLFRFLVTITAVGVFSPAPGCDETRLVVTKASGRMAFLDFPEMFWRKFFIIKKRVRINKTILVSQQRAACRVIIGFVSSQPDAHLKTQGKISVHLLWIASLVTGIIRTVGHTLQGTLV